MDKLHQNSFQKIANYFGPQAIAVFSLQFIPDAIAMFAAGLVAYRYRFGVTSNAAFVPSLGNLDYKRVIFGLIFAWLFILLISGVYKLNHVNVTTLNLRLTLKRSVEFFLVVGFVSFIFKLSLSRTIFSLLLTVGLIFILGMRLTIYIFIIRRLVRAKKITSKMLIVGHTKSDLEKHSDWIIKNRNLGFAVVHRLTCNSIDAKWVEEFDRLLRHHEVTEILFLPGMETDPNFSKFIHYCEDLGIHANWIPLDSGNLGYWLIPSAQEGIPFLGFENTRLSYPKRFLKRTFDLIFAISFILIFSWLYILIALIILFTSGRPIVYSSIRVGRDGRIFKFLKFRSMVKDADSKVHEIENMHGDSHVLFKSKDDPRVTKVGKILRKFSLDELPQFFNVISNSMSVVGPRPALVREVNRYSSIYERRLIAKPGITGPWQISGRSDLDLQTSVSLDLNYLNTWSFTKDLWIILATIGAIFRGRGAY